MLDIVEISARYGGPNAPTVVQDVTMSVAAGEIVGLVGESGCGKTTLARVVTGLHRPDAGVVRVAGFESVECFGDWDARPYDGGANRLIVRGTRARTA